MKRIALVVLVSFFGLSTYAQGLDLGIKAGANFANISDASNFDSKTGFTAGIFLGVKFSEKFAIQPELLYSQQGGDFEFGDFDLSYVNIPVIFKYYLFHGLNIQAGPQFGFVVDDKISFDAIGDGVSEGVKTNDFDVSGVVGLGYDLPLGLRISARYNFGLTDVFEEGGKAVDVGGKNSVISLALGLSFL